MDYTNLEGLISTKTKALILVHLYGQCGNIKMIKDLCKKRIFTLLKMYLKHMVHCLKMKG